MPTPPKAGELVMTFFHARTTAHMLHLKTRSYAAHKALNDFYDAVIGLTDSFAEVAQGEYGLIPLPALRYEPAPGGLELMEELAGWLKKNRKQCGDDSHLQNIIDELQALVRETQYKLKFLS